MAAVPQLLRDGRDRRRHCATVRRPAGCRGSDSARCAKPRDVVSLCLKPPARSLTVRS